MKNLRVATVGLKTGERLLMQEQRPGYPEQVEFASLDALWADEGSETLSPAPFRFGFAAGNASSPGLSLLTPAVLRVASTSREPLCSQRVRCFCRMPSPRPVRAAAGVWRAGR